MADAPETLLAQAWQARRENRLADAERILLEAVELCRAAGGVPLANALTALGQIERDRGRRDAARQYYEEAVAIHRVESDPLKVAHTVRHLGDVNREDGRLDLAEPCYGEALALYRADSRTRPLDLANTLRGYAILKERTGDHDAARRLWEEAGQLYAAVNVQAGVDESSATLARLARP